MSATPLDETSLRDLEAWLATDAEAPLDLEPARADLAKSLDELARVHDLVVRVVGALGRRRSIPPAARATLMAATARRTELLREVGEQIASWGASGGGIRLQQTATAQASAPSVHTSRTVVSATNEPPVDSAPEAAIEAERESAPQPSPSSREAPLTSDQIQAWLGRLRDARPVASAPVLPSVALTFEKQLAVLKQLMATLDSPREREGSAEWNAEAEALIAAMSRDRIETWKQMSPSMQRAWLAMLVSRARAATDPSLGYPLIRSRVNAMFPRLSAFSKEEQPGYVHGLAVTHLPTRGTWLADASHAWEELEQIIEGEEQAAPPSRASGKASKPSNEIEKVETKNDDEANELVSGELASGETPAETGETETPAAENETKAPKRKLATKKKPEPVPDEVEPSSEKIEKLDDDEPIEGEIEESWPGWGWVRHKRAVIFGGEVRETNRARLETAFEFAELAWVSVAQQRRVHSLVTRVSSGTVDIVLVLQKFVNHKTASKVIDACREAGVAWAMVENGYGVSAIRRSIDHHLGPAGTPLGASPAAAAKRS